MFVCGRVEIKGKCQDSQDDERSTDKIQREERFSAPVQTGLGAHPVSFSAEVKERVELYLHFASGPS
jgi:hypothetical protein